MTTIPEIPDQHPAPPQFSPTDILLPMILLTFGPAGAVAHTEAVTGLGWLVAFAGLVRTALGAATLLVECRGPRWEAGLVTVGYVLLVAAPLATMIVPFVILPAWK